MIERRRNEGCITVEMEAAVFFAVSHYYNIPLAQLLYAGDDVSGEEWDSRNWNTQKDIRYELLCIAIEIVKKYEKTKFVESEFVIAIDEPLEYP